MNLNLNQTAMSHRLGVSIPTPVQAPESEFNGEMTRLRLAVEANQELVRQLADRLTLVRHVQPEGKTGNALEGAPSSPIAGQLRDRASMVEYTNDSLRDILNSLAI